MVRMDDEFKVTVEDVPRGFGEKRIRSRIPRALIERSVNRMLEANQSDGNPTLTVAAFQSSI